MKRPAFIAGLESDLVEDDTAITPLEIRQAIDAGALTGDDLTAVFALTSMTGSDTGHCRDYRASHAR
jgi:hypothetical protein